MSAPGSRLCGLCGAFRSMTKAHVPPKSSGNDTSVLRAADLLSNVGERGPGRWQQGGMWVRSLCEDCNHLAGRRYDAAYADLAGQFRKYSTPFARGLRSLPNDPPPVSVAPGLVARCVMIGMFAINPRLRLVFPQLAEDLQVDVAGVAEVRWPSELALLLGRTDDRIASHQALLSGGVWHLRVLTRKEFHASFADIVFPPFVWCLIPAGLDTHADLGRRVSSNLPAVSDWVRYRPEVIVDIRALLRWSMPVFLHPAHRKDGSWVEMMGADSGPDREAVLIHGKLA